MIVYATCPMLVLVETEGRGLGGSRDALVMIVVRLMVGMVSPRSMFEVR